MPDSDPPSASPPLRTRRVRHKFRPILLLSGVLAVGLILGSDRLLRARQNLVSGIAGKSVQQFIPLSDLLSLRVERKNNFTHLYERIAASRSVSDKTEFAAASYELATFITAELSESDPRRRDAMLDVVAIAGNLPISSKAYWALLEPQWKKQLSSQYPTYATALTQFGSADGQNPAPTLIELARMLRISDQPQLELNALQMLRTSTPMSVSIAPSLERLVSILPEGDPDREKLQAELQAFRKRREQLAISMAWYQDFHAKMAKAKLPDLEAIRQNAPAGETNAFIASADAILATAYAKIGRFDDTDKVRIALARYDQADADDCVALASQSSSDGEPPPGKKAASGAQPPDMLAIQMQAWRGHLLLGQTDQAAKLGDSIFVGDLKGFRKAAEDENLLAKGAFSKLSPLVTLKKRSDNLPAELPGVTEAWYGQFPFKPTAKTAPAAIHTSADLWLTADKCVVIVTADEPRRNLPADVSTTRDANVWGDESIELFFNRDRWFDMYYQIDANTSGTIFDARIANTGSMTRRQYNKPDKSFNVLITAKTTKTDTGWQMRIVLPRSPLLPEADGAIKFNIRRFRRTTDKKYVELSQYSWTGAPGMDHKPEQFGWLIIPK